MSANIRVLFGTETGNAEDCAHELGEALQGDGHAVEVTDMADFEPSQLAAEMLAIIITSTYGNGDPPYNAEALMDWLHQPESSIAGVSFAVCGLGDLTYPRFAQAGKDFDRLMEERGGRRIVPRTDCDVEFEEPVAQFTAAVQEWLRSNGDTLGQAAAPPATPAAAPAVPVAAPAATAALGTRAAPVQATLVRRRRLNREGSAKETMHYEFTWSDATVAFEPGDSFALVPQNNPDEVRAVLEAAALDGAAVVRLGEVSQSLQDALMSDRDLHVVTADLLAALAVSGPGADAIAAGSEAVTAYLSERHLIDVLLDNPGTSIGAQGLVNGLRRLKPRLYSVASSPVVSPNEVHFTVETLRYTQHGRDREGVATTWLADRVADGDTVPMYCVKAGYFRLPEESDAPIIMVGPGTGIAPFRAFLQQRKALGDTGKAWLFFGHQHQKTDFLYEEELRAMQADGTLTELSLAWSRDQPEKVYVQDLIRARGAEVWAWLQDDAYVYVCGDKSAMAPQVRETFIELAVTHGGLARTAAEALVTNWEASGQYSVDAY